MHNWWIATLEHVGLLTREEAEHIAANIKNTIHKDSYPEAYRELDAIIGSAKFEFSAVVKKLEDKVVILESDLVKLKAELEDKVKPTKIPMTPSVEKKVANTIKA